MALTRQSLQVEDRGDVPAEAHSDAEARSTKVASTSGLGLSSVPVPDLACSIPSICEAVLLTNLKCELSDPVKTPWRVCLRVALRISQGADK